MSQEKKKSQNRRRFVQQASCATVGTAVGLSQVTAQGAPLSALSIEMTPSENALGAIVIPGESAVYASFPARRGLVDGQALLRFRNCSSFKSSTEGEAAAVPVSAERGAFEVAKSQWSENPAQRHFVIALDGKIDDVAKARNFECLAEDCDAHFVEGASFDKVTRLVGELERRT